MFSLHGAKLLGIRLEWNPDTALQILAAQASPQAHESDEQLKAPRAPKALEPLNSPNLRLKLTTKKPKKHQALRKSGPA